MTTTTRPDSEAMGSGEEQKPARRRGPGNRRDKTPPTTGRRDLAKRGLPGRPRQRGMFTAAALVLVLFALAGAFWFANAGSKTAVLAIGPDTVAKGQVVEREDLVSEQVSGGAGLLPAEDADQVVGQRASSDLVPGQLLTGDLLTSAPVPGEGKASVGLSLSMSQVPGDGLEAGDQVDVIAVPGESSDDGRAADQSGLDRPETLAASALVYGVRGASSSGGDLLVTVIVDDGEANRLAAYSTSNRVALVETSVASPAAGSSTSTGSGGS